MQFSGWDGPDRRDRSGPTRRLACVAGAIGVASARQTRLDRLPCCPQSRDWEFTINRPTKHDHHTVPRFYLNRFANGTKQVIRTTVPDGPSKLVSTKSTTVVKDFYMVETADGTMTDEIEESLSRVENAAAPAISSLVDGSAWPIPPETREAVSAWAAMQYLRTPAARQVSSEIADMSLKLEIAVKGWDGMREALEAVEGRTVSEAEVDEAWELMTDFDDYTLDPHQNDHIFTMDRLFRGTAWQFYGRSWNLIHFQRESLVTTDTPVVLMKPLGQNSQLPIGTATAGGVLVALDRRVGLIMTNDQLGDIQIRGDAPLASSLNQRIVQEARCHIFHHPDDNPLKGLSLPPHREREVEFTDPRQFLPEE